VFWRWWFFWGGGGGRLFVCGGAVGSLDRLWLDVEVEAGLFL
jgi:hypothetical protein